MRGAEDAVPGIERPPEQGGAAASGVIYPSVDIGSSWRLLQSSARSAVMYCMLCNTCKVSTDNVGASCCLAQQLPNSDVMLSMHAAVLVWLYRTYCMHSGTSRPGLI